MYFSINIYNDKNKNSYKNQSVQSTQRGNECLKQFLTIVKCSSSASKTKTKRGRGRMDARPT